MNSSKQPNPPSQEESLDYLVLPVAPPRPPKSECCSNGHAAINGETLHATDADGTTVEKSKLQASFGSSEAKNTDASCARIPIRIPVYKDESNSQSLDRKLENTSSQKNLDDHPLVAIVLVLLTVVATVFLGWVALNVEGGVLFLLPLFLIYGIAIDFFLKKRARMKHNE